MKATFYYNQYSQGGSVEGEAWELRDGNKMNAVYGAVERLKKAEIELPEGYSIGKDFAGDEQLYFNDYQVTIRGDRNKIHIYNGECDHKFILE